MGIFTSSEIKNPPKLETANSVVEIMPLLGLTQEKIDAHNKNLIQAEAVKYGASYYKDIAAMGDITSAPPVKLGEIALNPSTNNKSGLADSLNKQIVQMEAVMALDDLKKIKMQLEGFAEGYGQGALDAKDWETTVHAYNVATEGGIIHNAEVIKRLGEIFAADEKTRIKIYETISQIVNGKEKLATQIAPVQKEPIPITSAPSFQKDTIPTAFPTPLVTEPQLAPKEPTPIPTPLMRNEIAQETKAVPVPVINLAGEKPQEPITTPNGIVLRPVPTQNPASLAA